MTPAGGLGGKRREPRVENEEGVGKRGVWIAVVVLVTFDDDKLVDHVAQLVQTYFQRVDISRF